ncbi:MAG: ABC transporter permease [Gemmatimonadaceae bacterium]|nr:ABC transporter permease [Gemmatimonadaceae bacterium]
MDKVIAVIKREYMERVRSRWFIFATVFGPLLMAVLLFLPAWLAGRSRAGTDATNIVIIDASGNALGSRIRDAISANGGIPPQVRTVMPAGIAQAESTATKDVLAKRVQGYLVVDALTTAGERARYSGRNASTLPDMRRIQDGVRSAVLSLRFEQAGLDARRVQALSQIRLEMSTERLSERGRGGGGENSVFLAYGVAMLLYMSIVLYGQAIMMGVIEEKTQRVAEVVVASISPGKLLAGKVLGVGSVGLTQQLVWVGSALLMLKLQAPIGKALGLATLGPTSLPSITIGTGLALLCFFLLGYTLFATMFAAAGSMVSSTQDAQQVATPLTLLIMPSLLLLAPVMLEPGGTLARTFTLVPFTSPILMPVRMSLTSVSWFEVVGSIALLVATCLAAMWLAARIFRVGVLMYGKKPGFSELIRWVRVAR